MNWSRRVLLATLGSIAVPGCLGESRDLPDECPKTQGLGVKWPEELDASAVESFVVEYEESYYRDVFLGYEPESRLDSYELGVRVSDGPMGVDRGYEMELSGGGPVYRPTLSMGASVSNLPDGAEPVPVSKVDDAVLATILREAAENGEAELHIDTPGEEVDRYIERLASLSGDFEPLSERGSSSSLYVDVDGTPVELTVRATSHHDDYMWNAWYYVDGHTVRRTGDEEADPRDGELLECRSPE